MTLLLRAVRLSRRLPPSRWKVRGGRILATLARRPVVEVQLKDGTWMVLDARGRTEAEAVWNGTFEPTTLGILRRCLPAAGVMLDVGANVGLIAVPLANTIAATGGRVIAVEPIPENAERILAAAALNNVDITVLPVALGDQDRDVPMFRESQLGASTGNAVLKEAFEGIQSVERVVRMTTLDELARTIGRVDVCKLDVEGAEVLVLRGGSQFLGEQRPIVFGEFHSGLMPRFGHTFLDVGTICDQLDYGVLVFDANLRASRVQPHVGLGNVALVPNERVAAIERSFNRSASPPANGMSAQTG